jgi:predicted nucleotide-binding protein
VSAVGAPATTPDIEPRPLLMAFISSSMSGLPTARAFQLALEEQRDIRTIFWRQAFGPSRYNLENLEKVFASIDFAVFVLAPDDVRVKGGQSQAVPRDNVIFEAGMSVGRIGVDRTFLLVPNDVEISIPTDLAGLTLVSYSLGHVDDHPEQSMGIAATKVRFGMRDIGPRTRG